MRTKIKAAYVIADDGGGAGTRVFRNGEVVYRDDLFESVGLNLPVECDRVVDLGNVIVCPGFVDCNALGDIDHELFYCEQSHGEKLDWSSAYAQNGPIECMTPEEETFKSLYAYAQLIRHGITTAMPITSVYYKRAAETYEEIEAAAEHARRLGLRVYLGPSYISAMRVVSPDGRRHVRMLGDEGVKGLRRAERFVDAHLHDPGDILHPVMVPERVEFQTSEILKETKEFAQSRGVPVRLHAAQGQYEYDLIQARHGCSTVKYLDSLGFLDEKTLIPHAIFTSGYSRIEDRSDADVTILAERGTHVIHCPLVYSRSGMRLESFARFKRLGVAMCMGTDTFPPDMFANIRMGSAMSRNVDGVGPDSSYRAFFEAATIGGAQALGRSDLGRIAPGCKADFIAVSLDDFTIGNVDDPIRTLCMNACGGNVIHSVINGRTVMKDRRIPGVDYGELREKAQRYFEKMRSSAIYRSPYGRAFGDGSMDESNFFQAAYPMVG